MIILRCWKDTWKNSQKFWVRDAWQAGGLEGALDGVEVGSRGRESAVDARRPGAGNSEEPFPLLGLKGGGGGAGCGGAAYRAPEGGGSQQPLPNCIPPSPGVLPVPAIGQPRPERGRREAGGHRPQRSDPERAGQGGMGLDWHREYLSSWKRPGKLFSQCARALTSTPNHHPIF